jgi:protease IV
MEPHITSPEEGSGVRPLPPPTPIATTFSSRETLRNTFGISFTKTLAVSLALVLAVIVISVTVTFTMERSCNVAVHHLVGEMAVTPTEGMTDSDSLIRMIRANQEDPAIEAIVLSVDSPGGSPVAGEEIMNALARTEKPTLALIRGVGASAAYWGAVGADTIMASRNSDVGSIGVAVSFPDESKKNEQEGVLYNEYGSGKFKHLGTPNRPITEEEEALIEEGILEVFEYFVEDVAVHRNMSTSAVMAIADGATMTGAKAKEVGLVDALGDLEDARLYIEGVLGKEAILCELSFLPVF